MALPPSAFFLAAGVYRDLLSTCLESDMTSEHVYRGYIYTPMYVYIHLDIYRCDRSVTILVLIISLAQVVFSAPFTPIYVQVYIYIHGCVYIPPIHMFRCHAWLQTCAQKIPIDACSQKASWQGRSHITAANVTSEKLSFLYSGHPDMEGFGHPAIAVTVSSPYTTLRSPWHLTLSLQKLNY